VFGLLAREALADAVRRRIVPLIAAMALLSLFFVNSCTSCSPEIQLQGQSLQATQVTGVLGVAVMLVLGLWTVVLAGVLGSDHLAEPLADGSATLVLARPVSRAAFALSRLAGVLTLSFGTGAVLLFAAAVLLSQRQGLPPGPVLMAALACAASCVSVGGLAMAASLFLPRVATALLVFGLVWGVALVNVVGRSGAELSGWLGAADRYGPPLASAMILALWPWVEPLAPVPAGALADAALRSALWAIASAVLVVVGFRRLEVS
jgi:ABC-type transport system involved in multi-copper enzyme maturation permease subunit